MLDQTLLDQVAAHMDKLRHDLVLDASLDESTTSQQMREMLDELAALSPRITVTTSPDERTPSFAIRRAGTDVAVRFAGLPLGHEFTSLVLGLLHVGGHPGRAE